MNIPILNSIFSYLQGDGAVILPEIQLTLFGLGILLIGFSVDQSMENNWFWRLFFKDFSAKAAFAGVLFSGLSLWKLRGRIAGSGTLAGFHDSVVVDGFLIFFAALFLAATALVILLSAATGAVIGILMIVLKGRDRAAPMPFGAALGSSQQPRRLASFAISRE